MHTTPASLLLRLREPSDTASWERFVQLYTRLFFYWARRIGLQESDAADLVQDVFTTLVQKLPEFRYDRDKSFRNWLRTVLLNKWREHQRRKVSAAARAEPGALDGLAAPDDVRAFDEAEYRQHLVRRALELVQSEFSPKTWKACWEHVVAGRPAADVAAELGIGVGSVYVAKARVLGHLRNELRGLFD
jgi:RNA polymerase sigma-70 factor (ECF subfamily)